MRFFAERIGIQLVERFPRNSLILRPLNAPLRVLLEDAVRKDIPDEPEGLRRGRRFSSLVYSLCCRNLRLDAVSWSSLSSLRSRLSSLFLDTIHLRCRFACLGFRLLLFLHALPLLFCGLLCSVHRSCGVRLGLHLLIRLRENLFDFLARSDSSDLAEFGFLGNLLIKRDPGFHLCLRSFWSGGTRYFRHLLFELVLRYDRR